MSGVFRSAVEQEVAAAHARGETFQNIMADLATVMGCMVASGSPDRSTRLAYVKASMGVVANIIDRDLN